MSGRAPPVYGVGGTGEPGSIRAPGGSYVPLNSIVEFSERSGFRFIMREEGRTALLSVTWTPAF